MQQPSATAGRNSSHRQTHHILVIDDNAQLRSLLARHIMVSCHNHQRSCAIYHLGERSEPRLTYSYDPSNPTSTVAASHAEFMVYEAASPRHALIWIKESGVRYLTIISDVMMPFDTEVGLPGLLTGMSVLQVAVNLVFISSEPQNIKHVQDLLKNQRAFFLIKGSEAWNRLPEAVVQGAEKFNYQLLPNQSYSNQFIFPEPEPAQNVPLGNPASQPASRRFGGIREMGGIRVRTVTNPNVPAPVAVAGSQPQKSPGLLARLFGRR